MKIDKRLLDMTNPDNRVTEERLRWIEENAAEGTLLVLAAEIREGRRVIDAECENKYRLMAEKIDLSNKLDNCREGYESVSAQRDLLEKELARLVRLLEPLEQKGRLPVPGLATLNGARRAIAKTRGESG